METKTQPQHTQGEWNVNFTKDTKPDLAIFCKGLQIATIEPLLNQQETEANAERIVSAVNMYDELLSAVQLMRDALAGKGFLNKQSTAFAFGSNKTYYTILNNLLKRAEKK